MRPAAPLVAALLAVVLAVPAAPGAVPEAAIDASVRRELKRLKKLCDQGLVAPEVCLEKQRALLGVPAKDADPEAPAARSDAPPASDDPPALDAPPAATGEPTAYTSPLGYRLELPPGWTVLDDGQVAAGFDTLRGRLEGQPEAAELLERLRAQGLHRRADFFSSGRDQIQVMRAGGTPPSETVARARFCEQLAATTSEAAGRTLRTYACGPRRVAGQPAFYTERDALLPGTRTIQYWIEAPGDAKALHFVLSVREATVDVRRAELAAIVDSLSWP